MMATGVDSTTMYVLVVEDNPVDVALLQVALETQEGWPTETVVAEDGEKAISLLEEQAANPRLQKPDLILLDLNLPRRDGTEVLRMIRSTFGLSDVIVAILSSSPSDAVQQRLTQACVTANAYFEKPGTFEEYMKLGRKLHEWYADQLERPPAQ